MLGIELALQTDVGAIVDVQHIGPVLLIELVTAHFHLLGDLLEHLLVDAQHTSLALLDELEGGQDAHLEPILSTTLGTLATTRMAHLHQLVLALTEQRGSGVLTVLKVLRNVVLHAFELTKALLKLGDIFLLHRFEVCTVSLKRCLNDVVRGLLKRILVLVNHFVD